MYIKTFLTPKQILSIFYITLKIKLVFENKIQWLHIWLHNQFIFVVRFIYNYSKFTQIIIN